MFWNLLNSQSLNNKSRGVKHSAQEQFEIIFQLVGLPTRSPGHETHINMRERKKEMRMQRIRNPEARIQYENRLWLLWKRRVSRQTGNIAIKELHTGYNIYIYTYKKNIYTYIYIYRWRVAMNERNSKPFLLSRGLAVILFSLRA